MTGPKLRLGMVAEVSKDRAASDQPSFEAYGDWLKDQFGVQLQVEQGRYDSASLAALEAVTNSSYYQEFRRRRADSDDRYERETSGYRLFASSNDEPLQRKSWNSFLEKTWRKNVIANSNWPEPPAGGFLLPENWFFRINDIIRGSLVVKYLDGVAYLTKELRAIADELGAEFRSNLEARDEGYYAAHTYTDHRVNIPERDWKMTDVKVSFELQITTQLQEVIRKLTHKEYEQRRVAAAPPEGAWQWDYQSPSFTPNYLGHILHYMEGLIMEVRERGNA